MQIELGSNEFWQELNDNPGQLAAEVCSIDVAKLQDTLQQHAALAAWVNSEYERAVSDEKGAAWEVTKARARALLAAKEVLDSKTKKVKTLDVLNAEADTAPIVEAANERLLNCHRVRRSLAGLVEGVNHRRDMLLQLSANQRQEQRDYT